MNPYSPDGRDLRAEIAPYLNPDETLLWVGTSHTTRKYRPNGTALVFMLIWLAFAVFWTLGATAAGGAFGLFGLLFVGIGVSMIVGITVGARRRYASAVYAVTDVRAIILYTDRHGANCTAYVFSNLQTVTMERVQGTTGTIRFCRDEPRYDRRGRRVTTLYSEQEVGYTFESIDGVQEVYRLITEQLHG